jgi:DNA-directed RNA polymerase specialized sigma24 family protein
VLAQRHVDRLRVDRKLEPLPDDELSLPTVGAGFSRPGVEPADSGPHESDRCRELIRDALTRAVSELPSRERLRLACYYAQELTLAETGKLLGEHEATCSRHLARTRKTLRGEIERQLREQHTLSAAEIADCFGAASQDPGELDLRQLLRMEPDRKESRVDRSRVRGRT